MPDNASTIEDIRPVRKVPTEFPNARNNMAQTKTLAWKLPFRPREGDTVPIHATRLLAIAQNSRTGIMYM